MKTITENCEVVAEKILQVIELAEPSEWVEWDVFTGRQIHRKQSVRNAQKRAVVIFLEELLKE